MRRLLLIVTPILLGNAEPIAIEPAIRAMLDAAIATGSESDVATIVKYARAADPASGDAALAIADAWRAERAKAHETELRSAGTFDLWTGRAEIGGYLSTGNSETLGATATIDLTREGLQWRHKLHVLADYQRSLGVTSREHYLVAYEPNLKLDANRYIYGAAQFESDRFLGYDERYSASVGAGFNVVKSPAVTLDLELGPAFRRTSFTDARLESSVAARGSLDLDWKLTHAITFKQDATTYLERFNSTLGSTSALAAKLVGPLQGQVSYTVQYESMPPIGRVSTDTISRASLVYTF